METNVNNNKVFISLFHIKLSNQKALQGMNTVKFRDWKLIVNKELTKETYDKVHFGGSESCTCEDCKNFVNNFENIYPEEIKELFKELGVDYRKDCETWRMFKEDNGLHNYGGWFHFKGEFEGENCVVQINNNTSTLKLTPITENFSIGFCYNNSLTHFEDKQNLVQIEFETKVPWTIDKSFEGE